MGDHDRSARLASVGNLTMEHDFDPADECCRNCHMPRYGMLEFPEQLSECPGKPDSLFTSRLPEPQSEGRKDG